MNKKVEMPYEAWQQQKCDPENKSNYRYVLSAKVIETSTPEKPLVVVGINPSTADDKNKDATIIRVEKLAKANGYSRFVMVNVYPQRATDATELPRNSNEEPKQINENIEKIYACIKNSPCRDILLAYGTHIEDRKYLAECLKQIIKRIENLQPHYKYIAKTKYGHPCHPLFPYCCKTYPPIRSDDDTSYKIRDFTDIDEYLKSL